MNFTNKKEACRVLGNKQMFSDEVAARYLSESTYQKKYSWMKMIQEPGQTAHYVTVPPSELPRRHRKAFWHLRLLQLEYMLGRTESTAVARYLQVMKFLTDGSHISNRRAMEEIANRMEQKIIRCCAKEDTRLDKKDARIFLFAAALFADKNNLYDAQTTASFKELCRIAE